MRSIITCALLIGAAVFSGCNKEPEAMFTSDKDVYTAGDYIHLTNTSKDGRTYTWTLPGGETVSTMNVHYKSDQYFGNGELAFKLTAFSKNGKKENEFKKIVKVKAAKGDVMFWQKAGTGHYTTIVDIEEVEGIITYEYYEEPKECGSAGTAVFNGLTAGDHIYYATDGQMSWSGTIKVSRDTCFKVLLK
jgi:hypothetical protein